MSLSPFIALAQEGNDNKQVKMQVLKKQEGYAKIFVSEVKDGVHKNITKYSAKGYIPKDTLHKMFISGFYYYPNEKPIPIKKASLRLFILPKKGFQISHYFNESDLNVPLKRYLVHFPSNQEFYLKVLMLELENGEVIENPDIENQRYVVIGRKTSDFGTIDEAKACFKEVYKNDERLYKLEFGEEGETYLEPPVGSDREKGALFMKACKFVLK